MKTTILDYIYPRRCFVCDEILYPWENTRGIHDACRAAVDPIGGRVCMHCGTALVNASEYCQTCKSTMLFPGRTFTQGKVLFWYKGAMKKSMYRFKYSERQEYAIAYAAEAATRYGDWIRQRGIDVIIPVPMYGPKKRDRGYNQAEAFARELSAQLQIPVDTRLVKRVKKTEAMKTLSKEERRENLKNAFKVAYDMVQYYQIPLIVDDIYTTGATMDTIASLLKESGFPEVYALSICSGRGL